MLVFDDAGGMPVDWRSVMFLWLRDIFISRCSYRWPDMGHRRMHRCVIEPSDHYGPHHCRCGTLKHRGGK